MPATDGQLTEFEASLARLRCATPDKSALAQPLAFDNFVDRNPLIPFSSRFDQVRRTHVVRALARRFHDKGDHPQAEVLQSSDHI